MNIEQRQHTPPPRAPPPDPVRHLRLLVVDDDVSAIQQLGLLLAGYAQISFATNGDDALALASTQRPDLILLDAEMPGMSGFDVFKTLQAAAPTADIPVMFATSRTEPEFEAAALRMGAADFVTKPFVASQVLARVRALLQRPTRTAAPVAPTAPGHSWRPKLLIVDDDAAAIQFLQHLLADVGDCHFALDGEQALALAAATAPDLVLLDIDMPGIDGFEVCRRLRADPAQRDVPVVFITQHAQPDNEARAFEHRADDFIGKQRSGPVVLARVRRLVQRKRQADAEVEAVRLHWQSVGDARVAQIVEAASDAIVSVDVAGRIVLANAAACGIFGIGDSTAVGRGLSDFLPGLAASAPASGRQTLHRAGGTAVGVELSVSELGAGSQTLRTLVLRDMTAHDQAAAQALQRGEAAATRHGKEVMLSFIAHEMGNSLNAILGMSRIALADPVAVLPAAQARRTNLVSEAARRLQGLMQDVIDLNRLESGHFRVQSTPVDPSPVARAVCAELAPQADQSGVVLTLSLPVSLTLITADAVRLHQCLMNLVSNAIKYGGRNSHVTVGVQTQDNNVVVSVRDTGPGLTDAECAHLFEPYNRLGREGSKLPGTGLGLLLTRELATAMGGLLDVHCQVGVGCCFSLRFPRLAATA